MAEKKIIRIASTDIFGNIPLQHALRKIRGVNYSFAHAICQHLSLDGKQAVGSLQEKDVEAIEALMQKPNTLPNWLLNRRKDFSTGEHTHLTTAKLQLITEFDIKRLQALKSYRGLRHAWGLPVRGQRTKSHFRSGRSVGVQRRAIVQQKK